MSDCRKIKKVEVLDAHTHTRSSLPELPNQARAYHGAAAVGAKIYVFGGYGEGEYLTDVDVFDTATETWSSLAPLSKARCYHCCCAVGENIYILGGQSTEGSMKTLEVFNTRTHEWDLSLPDLPSVIKGTFKYVSTHQQRLYVTADDNFTIGTFAVFDLETKQWDERIFVSKHGRNYIYGSFVFDEARMYLKDD